MVWRGWHRLIIHWLVHRCMWSMCTTIIIVYVMCTHIMRLLRRRWRWTTWCRTPWSWLSSCFHRRRWLVLIHYSRMILVRMIMRRGRQRCWMLLMNQTSYLLWLWFLQRKWNFIAAAARWGYDAFRRLLQLLWLHGLVSTLLHDSWGWCWWVFQVGLCEHHGGSVAFSVCGLIGSLEIKIIFVDILTSFASFKYGQKRIVESYI